MLDKIIELLKEKPIIAPSKLFYNYKKLNINEQDLLVLIFLINASDETFNPTEISTNMDMKLKEVMTSINNLITQNLIEIETIKEKKIREIIKLDKMYEKLALIVNEETKGENTDIYTTFEKEFGRTLAPSELSVIKEFKEHYNEEIIQLALKEAIFNGVSEKMFGPDETMTRGMVITVLGRLENIEKTGRTTNFTDVPKGSYYEEYIAWGIENKIVTGTSENEFSPDKDITREEMAVMMANYVKYKKFDYELKAIYFSDLDTISTWALESVKILNELKIMQGNSDGTYNPKKVATRAEIATVFYNYLNYINS